YNKEGGEIKVEAVHEDNSYMVRITDTGIGISAEDLPFIFNRFKKLRQSLQQESFGLGLPIVRSIADFHQIKIDIKSEKGVGSTFKLIFPAELIG
ncbi:MAG: ATP-binding protein, partial [Mucilaginibacter sp.]